MFTEPSPLSTIEEAYKKTSSLIDERKIKLSDQNFHKLLFTGEGNKTEVINAHILAINLQTKHLLKMKDEVHNNNYYHYEKVVTQTSSAISYFSSITQSFHLENHNREENFLTGISLYMQAKKDFSESIPAVFEDFAHLSIAPTKIRMAIEFYFINILKFESARIIKEKGCLLETPKHYPFKISSILEFFRKEEYKKYIISPIPISTISHINKWSNKTTHTGIHSYPWQSHTAISILGDFFKTETPERRLSVYGFNYLNREHKFSDLISDLETFVSTDSRTVKITTSSDSDHSLEGMYLY